MISYENSNGETVYFPVEDLYLGDLTGEERRALLTHLLEAEAAERVEVLKDTYALDREAHWVTFKVGSAMAALAPGGIPFRIPSEISWDSILADSACLAAALAEKRRQRKRGAR